MKLKRLKSYADILVILVLFIFLSYLIQDNLDFFKSYLDFGFLGMLIFVFIVVLSIVFAPISSVPLFPVASGLWGWVVAAVLGVIGWTIGAVIAFLLARRYGVFLINKIVPVSRIQVFERYIPEGNIFWSVVFLRMVIPVDGLSYFLGLFSKMKLKSYIIATLIGITPFAFVIAYVGSMPFKYQMTFIVVALLIVVAGILVSYIRKSIKNKRDKKSFS